MFSGIVEHQAPLVDLKNSTECNQITLEFDEKRLENFRRATLFIAVKSFLTLIKLAFI